MSLQRQFDRQPALGEVRTVCLLKKWPSVYSESTGLCFRAAEKRSVSVVRCVATPCVRNSRSCSILIHAEQSYRCLARRRSTQSEWVTSADDRRQNRPHTAPMMTTRHHLEKSCDCR